MGVVLMVRAWFTTEGGTLPRLARFALPGAGAVACLLLLLPVAATAAPGPTISQLIASDPDNGDAVFGNGDLLRFYFDKATNKPGAPLLDTEAVDSLFSFSNSIGNSYEGKWVADDLLLVRILDAGEATPAVGSLTAGITGLIVSANGTSDPGEGVSPVLSGNWGTASQAGERTPTLTMDILPPAGFPSLPTLVAQGANVFFEVEVRNRGSEPAAGVVCLDADPSELRVVALAGKFPAADGSNRVCAATNVLAPREVQKLTATTAAIAPECTRAEANVVLRTQGSSPASLSVAFGIAQGGGRAVVGPSVVSEGDAFTVSASAAGCFPDTAEAASVGYAWSCTTGASSPCVDQNTSAPLVLPAGPQVDVPVGALSAGAVHTFRVVSSEPARAQVQGELAVTVNRAPSSGFCTVSPVASAPEQEVVLECAGWGDAEGDVPLGYRFGVVREGETIWLSGFLTAPVLATKLPALSTDVVFTIEDTKGARSGYSLPVDVAAPTFSDTLPALLASEFERAEELFARNDSAGFLATAHSIAGVLHIATDAVSTAAERSAARRRLGALFLALARESSDTAGTAGSLEAALHLLAEIVRRPAELDAETIEIAAAILETLMLDGRSAASDKGADGVDAALMTLVVTESLIDATEAKESDPTSDPETLAAVRRARVEANGRLIDAGGVLLKNGVAYPGESPADIVAARAGYKFARDFSAEIVGDAAPVRFDHALGSISLPATLFDALPKCPASGVAQDFGDGTASCTPAVVDVAFAAFESNPYTYSAGDTAGPVLSAVVSTPDGLKIPVDGLLEPVTITIPHTGGPGSSISNLRCMHFDRAEDVWSDDGCTTVSVDSSSAECACTHLSSFTVQSTLSVLPGLDQQKCFFKMQGMAGKVAKLHKKAHSKCLKLAKKGKITDAEECAQKVLAPSLARAAQKTLDSQLKHCVTLPDFAHSSAGAINAAAYGETGQIFSEVLGTNGQGQVRSSSASITTASCLQKVAIGLDKVSSYRRKMVAKRIKAGIKDGVVASSADAQRLFLLPDGVVVPIVTEDDQKFAAKVAKAESKLLKLLEKKCTGVDLAEAFPGVCAAATSPNTFSDCANESIRCHTCREGRETLTMFADCDLVDNGSADGSCS
jgi:hypothetical protein